MKSIQLFVILILISFILFILFQLERVESKEGFDPAVPTCESSVGSYSSSVPTCHATVQEDGYLDYPKNFMSDYILKTKIVTPVCPNDPYDDMGSILDFSFNNWNINLNTDISGSNASGPVPSNVPGGSSDASIPVPSMPTLIDNSLSTPQKPVDPKPACKEDKESSPDVCPPCPACDRCPEPVVDCKKVIRYKDQQYPVPVIADFSHFSRF
jgi:hypothetical protein